MATALFHHIIFGPVQSRRLGVSLGVNLLPDNGKLCNFDCIYCECGWNADNRKDQRLPTREQVRDTLKNRLQQMRREGVLPDAITFSGNGEPTLHPHFSAIINDTIALRNAYAPSTKICVLSNATTLSDDDVVRALQKIDKPILKIDSGIANTAKLINQPQGKYSVAGVVKQLQDFNGKFTLQTLFLRGSCIGMPFDNSTPEEIEKWLKIVAQTQPGEIMIYTINRDTPSQTLQKLSKEELNEIARKVAAVNSWGAVVQVSD